jgi:nitrous oxidase accessory protein NosD
MRDITLATGVAGTSGAAVLLNQAAALGAENAWDQSDFTNVTIRGCDGPDLTYYWGTGIQINGVSGVNFFNLKIDGQQIAPYSSVGVGVSIYGTAAIIPVTYLGSGLSYGAYVQGVTLSQCNFTGGAIGVISPASAVGTVLSQLAVVGCQFNCSNYGIYNDAGIAAVTVSGTYFFELQPGSVGIYLAQTEAFSIINNVFEGPGGTNTSYGINIGTNPLSFAGVISGNVFFRNYYGVVLEASSSCVNLQSNGWSANTNNYINMGSNNTIGGGSV